MTVGVVAGVAAGLTAVVTVLAVLAVHAAIGAHRERAEAAKWQASVDECAAELSEINAHRFMRDLKQHMANGYSEAEASRLVWTAPGRDAAEVQAFLERARVEMRKCAPYAQ